MDSPHTPRKVGSDAAVKGPWKDQIAEARFLWRRLGEDELLRSEGKLQTLTQLVQQRYEVSRYTAESQVQDFLDRWKRGAAPDNSTGS